MYESINYRDPSHILVGFETSGGFHLGHYVLFSQIIRAHNLDKNLKFTVLLSDVHARLNEKKWVEEKKKQCIEFIKKMMPFVSIKISGDSIKDPLYWQLFLKINSKLSFRDIIRSFPYDIKKQDPLKQSSSHFCYSLMQNIDHQYFKAETIWAGVDQRNIYMMGYDTYPKLNWNKPSYRFYPLLTMSGDLTSDAELKMSKSKACLTLDQNLYKTVKRALSGHKTLFDHVLTDQLLNQFSVDSKVEFLSELEKNLYPVRDYCWNKYY